MTQAINHDNNQSAKSAQFLSGLPDLNAAKPYRPPLRLLYGCRVKLNDEDRAKLKHAYRTKRDAVAPVSQSMPGSTVSSSTQVNLDKQLGLGSIVMTDLLVTRESIPLPTLLRLQNILEVEVVTRQQLEEAATSYIDYVLETFNE